MTKAQKLPSGKWRANLYLGKVDGKPKYKSFTASTKKEAEYMAMEYKVQGEREKRVGMTLGEAFDSFLESYEEVLSPSTFAAYNVIRRNSYQQLLDVPISDISNEMVQREISNMAAALSPKTVRNRYGFLTKVLSLYAPGIKLNVKLPQKIKTEVEIPTEEEVKEILEKAKGTPLYTPVLLGAFGCMRRSEICALTPEDFDGKHIRINKALVKGADGQWYLKTTKTIAGTRTVTLPDFVAEQIELPVTITPDAITKRFGRASGKYHFHALRHYNASIKISLGIPDIYIMQEGGWDDLDTLKKIYQHTIDAKKEEFQNRAFAYFETTFLNGYLK